MQSMFDVEVGKNRRQSRHLVSPPANFECKRVSPASFAQSCQLIPYFGILTMVDQPPDAEATRALCDGAVRDTHTTTTPDDEAHTAGQK